MVWWYKNKVIYGNIYVNDDKKVEYQEKVERRQIHLLYCIKFIWIHHLDKLKNVNR